MKLIKGENGTYLIIAKKADKDILDQLKSRIADDENCVEMDCTKLETALKMAITGHDNIEVK